ncbi:hypothetical protein A2U01_0052288, partial [Trifolium medium]|nr:hypothetical protein [Trifolium medium]
NATSTVPVDELDVPNVEECDDEGGGDDGQD